MRNEQEQALLAETGREWVFKKAYAILCSSSVRGVVGEQRKRLSPLSRTRMDVKENPSAFRILKLLCLKRFLLQHK